MTSAPASSRRRARHAALAVLLGAALASAAFAPAWAAGGDGGNDAKPEAFATIGKIYSQTVEIKKKSAGEFQTASEGDELKVGDTVRTDATGRVRINYSDDSFTRLDFDTTFTIKKLADDQGNRQVEGSLEDGKAWHRTAALTESQSFEQTGAGATAAAVGTGWSMECDLPTHCVFIAVVDGIRQEGTGGVVNLLNPLDFCDATGGELCDEVQTKTIAEMVQNLWIQFNLGLDMSEYGLGPGPFFLSATVVVENGQVVSFTPNPPAETPPQVVDQTNPIGCNPDCDGTTGAGLNASVLPDGYQAGGGIQLFDGDLIDFVANLTVTPTGLFIVFTSIGSDLVGKVSFCSEGCDPIDLDTPYAADTVFTFDTYGVGSTTFQFRIQDANGNVLGTSPAVPVTVSTCGVCLQAEGTTAASDPPPSADPPPDDTPPSTAPPPPAEIQDPPPSE